MFMDLALRIAHVLIEWLGMLILQVLHSIVAAWQRTDKSRVPVDLKSRTFTTIAG